MSARSGELARRAALGMGQARNGAEVAQALQTIRYSALDKRRPEAAKNRSRLVMQRQDNGHLQWALSQAIARLKDEGKKIADRIARLGSVDRIEVSDHALVRFLERVMGMDLDAVRAQIARLVPADRLEDERILYIRNGFQFLVAGGVIVTILDAHMDSAIEEAFAIDDASVAPPRPVKASESAASQAARTLARHSAKYRANRDALHAQLRAELGR